MGWVDLESVVRRVGARVCLCSAFGFGCGDFSYEGELTHFAGSSLPILVIEAGSAIRNDPKLAARLLVFDQGVADLSQLTESVADYEGRIGIELRGHVSLEFPKKQYGFELRDAGNEDLEVSLLGLPEDSDWVLHAPFMDKSLIRNHLAYDLSRAMGNYAPRTRFCELFLTDGRRPVGPEQYRGVYVLTEKIEPGTQRVDLGDLSRDPAAGGGYLLEWTESKRIERGDQYFSTASAEAILVKHPQSKDLTVAALQTIERDVLEFEAALSESSALDESSEASSFADYLLLNELLRNYDVFVASTFIHKGASGKLRMGPVWDFDRSIGDVDLDGNWRPDGWLLPTRGWGKALSKNPSFLRLQKQRWRLHRSQALSTANLVLAIDSSVASLGDAPARNFEKWRVLGRYVKVNRAPYSESFDVEIHKLKAWLAERAAWMDEHID